MASKFGPHVEQLSAVAASPGGRLVAIGGYRDTEAVGTSCVHLLSAPKWTSVSIEMRSATSALCFADGELLLIGSADGALTGYDVAQEAPSRRFRGEGAHEGAVLAIACRGRDEGEEATASLVATAGEDGVLRLYHLAGGVESAGTRKLSARPLRAVAIDPEGRYVAAAGDDGVIRSVPLSSEQGFEGAALREMPCGEGGIGALCFPGDGRIVAGCGDGSIRVCFLEGAVDEENRAGDAAHSSAVRQLIYSARLTDKADRELERRLLSLGEDGTIKAWQLDSRRKPRTTEVSSGPLRAAALLPGSARAKADRRGGTLALADDKRQLRLYSVSESVDLALLDTLQSEIARLAEDLRASKDEVRLAAVKALSELPEDAARELLDHALAHDKKPEVRRLAAKLIGETDRRLSRPMLRLALDDGDVDTRRAAFEALLAIEKEDTPLAPLKAALGSTHEGIRLEAVKRLPALRDVSPLVPGLIADRLCDDHKRVRAAALDALSELEPPPSLAPIRVALSRGPADMRIEAITRLGLSARASQAADAQSGQSSARSEARQLLEGALDDADDKVRSVAFLVSLATRASLSARLKAADQHTAKALTELEKRGSFSGDKPADTLGDDDLEPLFAAIASRNADTALRGARCLALLADGRATGALLQLSREPDAAMRRYVVEALTCAAKRMPGDDRVVTRLSWLLDDGDATVRTTAFDALLELAKPEGARGQLELGALALRCGFDDTRVAGLGLLVKFGGDGEHAKATSLHARADALLGDALDDEAAQVRLKALATLKTWHSSDVRVALERAGASRHADIRRKVVSDLESRKESWASALLLALAADASADVGLAAYKAATKTKGAAKKPEAHLAALSSPRPSVRAAGAKGSVETDAQAVRKRLIELLDEEHSEVFLAAIEAIDKLLPEDQQAFALAFSSIFYELRVRAAELCGKRRDRRAVEPMKKLLTLPNSDVNRPTDALRQRAARAIADVGDPAAIPFCVALLDDEDGTVREMGGRGLATACRPGEEQPLVDALSHADLAVRSWAAEGLAKLGDPRAIPVLAGTQRHEHRPIRIGALLSFVALGPDGVRGILQGLEDPEREIQDLVFAVIVARDVALARAGVEPDLLLSALSSAHPEIRFAAARTLEARIAGDQEIGEWASELVGPQKPERAGDMKDWPEQSERAALRNVVVSALASDHPALRYAAAQALSLRGQPLAYFREAARLRGPSGEARWVPHTNWEDGEARQPRKRDWIRRVFGAAKPVVAASAAAASGAPASGTLRALAAIGVLRAPTSDQGDADAVVGAGGKRLVFGTFAGLVRQAPPAGEADETHRVRRDSLARLAALGKDAAVGRDAVLPVMRRALSDPSHLVRKAAVSALRELYEEGSLEPLALALDTEAADVGRAAVDELLAAAQAGGDAEARSVQAAQLVRGAIEAPSADVRRYALERLPRLYEQGSLEPWLLALESNQADVRLAVVDRLIDARDARVAVALGRALESDHEDLRMKAAVALARRGDARTIDVLVGFLRSEEPRQLSAAIEALVELSHATPAEGADDARVQAAGAAAEALVARLEDDPDKTADRAALVDAIARVGSPRGAPALYELLADEDSAMRERAFEALLSLARRRDVGPRVTAGGVKRQRYDEPLLLESMARTAKCANAELRRRAALALRDVDDARAEEILGALVEDREQAVRVEAAEALAFRAEHVESASIDALSTTLRAARRELVLPAAVGLAGRGRPESFQALLLVFKAGEQQERERALLSLGTLGDRRALEEIEPLVDTRAEIPDEDRALAPAAAEALGRMLPALAADSEAAEQSARVRETVERLVREGDRAARTGALRGLRYAGDARSRALIERVAVDRFEAAALRIVAVQQLGQLADVASAEVLGDLLDDKERGVRDSALAALERIFSEDKTRVALMALGSQHAHISAPAASYLARRGDAATLVARLGEVRGHEVRRRLRHGLVRRGACPVPQLESLLGGDDDAPRAEAAWIAGASGNKALASAVVRAVAAAETGWKNARARASQPRDGEDGNGVAAASRAWRASLWAARQLEADVAAAARTALAAREHPTSVRREAIRYLGAQAGAQAGARAGATDVIVSALSDPDAEIRAAAASAVSRLEPTRGAAILGELSAPDAAALSPIVRAALPLAGRELLADERGRQLALPVCIGEGRVEELIAIASAEGKDPARLAAIAALGRIGGAEARAALEQLLARDGEQDAIKAAAYRALRRLQRAESKSWDEDQDQERGTSRYAGYGGGGYDYDDDDDDDDDDWDDDDDDDDDEWDEDDDD